MKDIDLAYLAGLVDGEGYVGIKRSKAYSCQDRKTPGYHARIQVRMVYEPAIRFLAETLGGWYYREQPHCNNGRPLFCWQASDKAAARVLALLLPFLRVKKRQAELILEFRELQGNSRQYRTKVTGYRILPHHCGKAVKVRNLAFSDEYVSKCDEIWNSLRKLNGLARFNQN